MSLEREKETLQKMFKIYCKAKHGSQNGKLCSECKELLNYALKRLELCPFKEEKPSCKKCTIHCYQPEKRKKIKEVMRFSGPRLLLYDPFNWLIHKVKERTK
ncbi:nitrous oxide-stimulated promoter family protein [Desulfurobacterium thermolithotrophum]|uniref:nitrous oxide-stimulated promoter family protein n=1 Tax=Desulfurobacterium thermolithotrophum TaxID=64160 RepID=UPI0013D47F22